MPRFANGDYVKAEFLDEATGESEWMWVIVSDCNDENRVLFGVLDSQPVIHSSKLRLGQELAVSFDKVREHRKATSFQR